MDTQNKMKVRVTYNLDALRDAVAGAIRVEKMDDSMSAASGDAATGTWQVGGRTFVVNDATAIDANLAQSSLAVVNSYKAADGTQVATRIDAVNVNSLLFLPSLSNR